MTNVIYIILALASMAVSSYLKGNSSSMLSNKPKNKKRTVKILAKNSSVK
jgi:hypothetical protein